jgi:hypothetical protein
MRALYTIGFTPLRHVYRWCQDRYDTTLLTVGQKLTAVPTSQVVIVPSVHTFFLNRLAFNKSRCVVLLVDSPVCCHNALRSSDYGIDYVRKGLHRFRPASLDARGLRRRIDRSLDSKTRVKIDRIDQTRSLALKMLKRTDESFVSQIMNYLYRINDTTKREELKQTVFQHLSKNRLPALVKSLETKYARSPVVKEFTSLLITDIAVRFASAVNYSINNPTDTTKSVCKTYGVSSFDLQYALKYIQRTKTK